MKTLVLDFDGVLHSYSSGWKGDTQIPDPPVPGAMEFVAEAIKHFKVEIFSSRSRSDIGIIAMKHWMLLNLSQRLGDEAGQRVFTRLYFPRTKPPAHVSLDDRAICFTGTFPDLETLKAFKPWNR